MGFRSGARLCESLQGGCETIVTSFTSSGLAKLLRVADPRSDFAQLSNVINPGLERKDYFGVCERKLQSQGVAARAD